jgi:cation:H+ antiporter
MLVYFLFVLGFYFLIKGADFLVEGASSLARRLKVSDLAVGLTIVSFGTSMPEMVVNLFASFSGQSEIALGNVFGSNIANVLLILGITAIICPLPLKRSTIFSEIPFTLIAALLVGFLANAALFEKNNELVVSRLDGVILLFFFGLYMAYIFSISKKDEGRSKEKQRSVLSVGQSILYILGGVVLLFLGGKWIVDGAVKIAGIFGLSQSFVGLTVVAVGTSLPELVTSVVAAFKKNIDIAVGNVIGSNIFNLLWILGVSAAIRPLPFDVIGNVDVMVMVFSSTMIILVIGLGRKNNLNRLAGVIFVVSYLVYIFYLIKRR